MKTLITAVVVTGVAWSLGYRTGQIDGGVAVYRNAQRMAEKRYDAQLRSDDRVRGIIAHERTTHAFLYNGYSIHIYADAKGTHVEFSEVC